MIVAPVSSASLRMRAGGVIVWRVPWTNTAFAPIVRSGFSMGCVSRMFCIAPRNDGHVCSTASSATAAGTSRIRPGMMRLSSGRALPISRHASRASTGRSENAAASGDISQMRSRASCSLS